MTSSLPTTSASGAPWVDDLRAAFDGQVVVPGDADYDAARTVFSGNVDKRPAAVVRPRDAAGVARVVRLARDTGVELAVRSGGHSGAGHSASEGGLVLDLSAMKGLEIDAEGRTAWAEAGLTAGEYTTAVGAYGLATGFGDTGSVGLGGITLGGGVGFLSRKHGLTIDNLLAAEVVTADGEVVRCDEETHPDLFWALRGGGGNTGVVTRLRFRLHPVESVVGGMLLLPATPETVAGAVALAEDAPEELSTIANVMVAPPLPFLAEEYHGTLVLMAEVCWAGPTDEGERVLAPFRALAEPLADMVQETSYAGMFPEEEEFHPRSAVHTMFLDRVDRQVAETALTHLGRSTASMAAVQIRVLGGAIARVPADATAYAHRASRLMVNVAAVYEDPAEAADHQAWVDTTAAALRQDDAGAYVNFLGDEPQERVRAAYPGATWDRLRAVKAAYDPGNLFRLNQNVPPA